MVNGPSIKDHNERAAAIWALIEPEFQWFDKRAIDLGCGHGDMLWRLKQAGCKRVTGVENGRAAIMAAWKRISKMNVDVGLVAENLDQWLIRKRNPRYDVVLCFSVLPYLRISYHQALAGIKRIAPVMFFEVQHMGDGPGKEVANDDDIRALLMQFYDDVDILGHTLAKGQFPRAVWKCGSTRSSRVDAVK
jgi:hypothetical protein